MSDPLVSVYIPTYNRAGFLRECLTALIDQGLDSSEYVVVVSDNASPDDTGKVVDAFRERLQISYHRRPETLTAMQNINGLTELVETPYVSLLCDDDLLVPGQLGRAMTCLRRYPEAVLYGTLGLAQTRFGDTGAVVLGTLLDVEPTEEDPFLFRWKQLPFLANCSIQTPLTVIGSVFKLAAVPKRPLFSDEFPQEGDRLLFLQLAEAGEIYSSAWIGGHLRYHPGQLTNRNHDPYAESARVTLMVLEKARELGHDVPGYWIEHLPGTDLKQLELLGSQIKRAYPKELTAEILEKAGVYKRWEALRKDRRRAKKRDRARRGIAARFFRLFGG